MHSYAVNNTIQHTPKAPNTAETAQPTACKSYLPSLAASPPFPTNPPLAPRVLILTFKPSKECFPESAALFAYGQLTGVWGNSLSQSHPTLHKHLYTITVSTLFSLLMRASAKAQVTLVTKL